MQPMLARMGLIGLGGCHSASSAVTYLQLALCLTIDCWQKYTKSWKTRLTHWLTNILLTGRDLDFEYLVQIGRDSEIHSWSIQSTFTTARPAANENRHGEWGGEGEGVFSGLLLIATSLFHWHSTLPYVSKSHGIFAMYNFSLLLPAIFAMLKLVLHMTCIK